MSSSMFGFWIFITCISYVLAICQIYGFYRFKSLQSLTIIQKRYPKFVLIESVFVIIFLVIVYPLWCNQAWQATNFGNPLIGTILDVIGRLLLPATTHFIGLIETIRLYLISYDLHYLQSSEMEQWKAQIDVAFAEKDWYLRNKNRNGNAKWVFKRVFIYYLCIIISIPIIYALTWFLGFFIEGMFYFIMIGFIVRIWYKSRKHKQLNDKFFFYYELRATMLIWLSCLGMFFLMVILWWSGVELGTFLIITLLPVCSWTAPSLFSTLWIPRKITRKSVWSKHLNSVEKMMEESVDQSAAKTWGDKLKDTLKDEVEFQSFIEFMYREFSQESALCYIELVQWKQCIVNYIGNSSYKDEEYTFIGSLYDTVPRSTIVYNNANDINISIDTDIKCDKQIPSMEMVDSADSDKQIAMDLEIFQSQCRLLYDKYIQYDSPLEINISGYEREKYLQYDIVNWDMSIDKLVNIFDPVMYEAFSLMTQSFIRYHSCTP
eukprot:222963_1